MRVLYLKSNASQIKASRFNPCRASFSSTGTRVTTRRCRDYAPENAGSLRYGSNVRTAARTRTARAYPAPRHETHNAHGLAIFLARWRDAEQRHIKAVLSGAPHAGIVIAL